MCASACRGLQLQDRLERLLHLAADALAEGLEHRDALRIAPERERMEIPCIGVLRQLAAGFLAALRGLGQDPHGPLVVLLEVGAVHRGGLVGHRGAEGAELRARLAGLAKVAAVKGAPGLLQARRQVVEIALEARHGAIHLHAGDLRQRRRLGEWLEVTGMQTRPGLLQRGTRIRVGLRIERERGPLRACHCQTSCGIYGSHCAQQLPRHGWETGYSWRTVTVSSRARQGVHHGSQEERQASR